MTRRLAALLLGALACFVGPALAQAPSAPSAPQRSRQPATRPPARPSPPAPSVPPVTRAEADAVLAALSDAYAREDEAAVERLHAAADMFAFKARRDARKLFAERNAIALAFEVQEEERKPDGALSLETVVRRSTRPVRERLSRREKFRLHLVFTRLPSGQVVLASQLPAEAGLLPSPIPWRNPTLRGEVSLAKAPADRRIAVDVVLGLVNASERPADEVGFALHPFSSGLVAHAGEAAAPAERREASLDAWVVKLPQAVAPGQGAELRLTYELEQPGDVAACAIEPDLVRLYGPSAWLPIVEPVRLDPVPERAHDVVVVAPDGMATSMPGRRTQEAPPGPGLHADRFTSEVPGVETPLVAVRGSVESRQLGPSLVLDVLRAEGGGDPARAVSYFTTLAVFLEDRLGPCPVTRLAIAESIDGGFKESPGWLALPTLDVPRGDWQRDEDHQVFLFAGLTMTRLWIVHARAPAGIGAKDVALGLCEHLVGKWAAATIDPKIPARQRGLILSYVQLDPQLDQPLLGPEPDTSTPRIFKQDKARMAFDGYELLAGSDAWRDALLRWQRETPRGARIETLLDRMGGTPEKDAYLDAFFRRQGTCQVSIADMRLVPLGEDEARTLGLDPEAWKHVEIEIDNAGLGPVPVQVRRQEGMELRWEQVTVPESGRAVVRWLGAALPPRVWLDPDQVLWQSRSDDDVFPAFRPKTREEFEGGVVMGHHGADASGEVRRDPRR